MVLFIINQPLVLSLEERDAEELILVLRGYHKLFTDRVLPIHRERTRWTQDSGICYEIFQLKTELNKVNIYKYVNFEQLFYFAAPPYHIRHTVQPAPWSFIDLSDNALTPATEIKSARFADLSIPPPYHPPPEGFQVNNTNSNKKNSTNNSQSHNWDHLNI